MLQQIDSKGEIIVSVRTLRRRLQEEGKSYKEITHELRMSLAEKHLTEGVLSTKEISFLLDYNEVSNCQRAVKN